MSLQLLKDVFNHRTFCKVNIDCLINTASLCFQVGDTITLPSMPCRFTGGERQ